MKYSIVVDYGKPYEIKVNNELQLDRQLKDLRLIHDMEEHPYFDVWVYDDRDNDVTDSVMR